MMWVIPNGLTTLEGVKANFSVPRIKIVCNQF